MAERELTATVGDVSASHDYRGRLESVEVRLTYETSHTTNTGKKRVSYGAAEFRFAVDADGIARLAELNSRGTDTGDDGPEGADMTDVRAVPAAVEIVEGIAGVDRVEPVTETITERIGEIGAVDLEGD